MKAFLALTRPFTLEVLVCLIMVLSMAVGVVCIGGYRLIIALSRMSVLGGMVKDKPAVFTSSRPTTHGLSHND
jgi:hypothetical protein